MSEASGTHLPAAPLRTYVPAEEGGATAASRERPQVGILEWLRPGEHERVEQVLADLKALGVRDLRTGVSWADWYTPEGEAWYSWLLPRLAQEVRVLPCFVYTPPSLGIAPKSSSPPREPRAYADWLDVMITRFGDHFDWVELWNEPNNLREWDATLDPQLWIFCEMIGAAAYWARCRGKKTLLGGLSPVDPHWLRLMIERGVVEHLDAIGIHGFPGTFDYTWDGWDANVSRVKEVLRQHQLDPQIWITEAGYSTWRHDERRQLREFVSATAAPVDRVYWYSLHDLAPALPTVDGFHSDEREYHFGLKRADHAPKLLYRLWASGGLDAVREAAWMGESSRLLRGEERPVLITGGAGFLGSNLARCLLESGQPVLIFDNLSRPGAERNLQQLREEHPHLLEIEVADLRDPFALGHAVERAGQVFHFAAQTVLPLSLSNPGHDFEVNARGTLNLLEALRGCTHPPPLVFASTSRVYGSLDAVALQASGSRCEPVDFRTRTCGINEEWPLRFGGPHGCSKGCADEYVLDYARTFDLPAMVLRLGCIYGPLACAGEDESWLTHLLRQAARDLPLTLAGEGRQVRDALFVDDLLDACLLAQANLDRLSGEAFNVGGGPGNALSSLELLELLREWYGRRPVIIHAPDRPGDPRYYVSDNDKFRSVTGWAPRTTVRQGIRQLYDWLTQTVEPGAGSEQRAPEQQETAPRSVAPRG